MRFIVTLMLGAIAGFGAQPESPDELVTDLGKAWSVLTVSVMTDQGCVAPYYDGIRIRRYDSGITIAPWREVHEKQVDGAALKLSEAELKTIVEAVSLHYKAAIASIDIHEYIASLATEEERKKEWAMLIKAAGGTPIGGFGSHGIDIRIQGFGITDCRYGNSYGETGSKEFHQWLGSLGMK